MIVGVWDSAKALRKPIFWLLWGLTFCGGKKNVSNVFILNMMKSKMLTKGIWLEVKQGWILPCWAPKNWCFWTVVLEKTLESPLDSKEIQPVHSKGDQPWVFSGRTDAEAETPVLWPSHAKSWLIGKDSDAGSDWGQDEKGTTEDEMAGWHHRLDGHEFE